MDGKTVTLIAILAVVVGILVGYLVWGNQAQQLANEVAAVKARAQQAGVQEGMMATKLQRIGAQIKEAAERLKAEQDQRQKLEALAAKQPKKK